jgi:hypothetical protein
MSRVAPFSISAERAGFACAHSNAMTAPKIATICAARGDDIPSGELLVFAIVSG